MFDAWIANQDRHHENWGVITLPGGMTYLAPSYDHASSLGAIESDHVRQDRLTTRDQRRSMAHYVQRARSAFYRSPDDPKPMSTVEAFRHAASRRPHAAQVWLTRLSHIEMPSHVRRLFDQIPDGRKAQHAADFAMQMLALNRQRLLELHKGRV